MKQFILLTAIATLISSSCIGKSMNNMWNKENYLFALSDKVIHQKVEFKNRYGITLVANLYIPKHKSGVKLAAIAVKRSLNSNGGWNITSALSFINMPLLTYSNEIRSAVLLIHGKKAHTRYFSEDAFKLLTGSNKELLIIPGASHVDLYDDKAGVIPYDKMETFFNQHLK